MSQAEDFCKELNAAYKLPSGSFDNAMIRICNRYGAQQVARMPGLYVMNDGSRAQHNWRRSRVEGKQPFQVVTS